MSVLFLTVFVSLSLAGLGVGLFVWTVREKTLEHADRLAILPLEGERPVEESKSCPLVERAGDALEV